MPRTRSNSAEIAAQKILFKIENYELKAGDTISDSVLAEEIGISRTPVREAIMELVSNGVLERKKNKIIVSPITLSDIIEIIELRDCIEQKAVELIINHGGLNNEQRQSLVDLQNGILESISNFDISTTFYYDHLFHSMLFDIADNHRLKVVYDTIILQTQRLRWLAQLTPPRFVNSYKEHQLILDAIFLNDIKSAQNSIHTHLLNTLDNYKTILSSPQIIHAVTEISDMI